VTGAPRLGDDLGHFVDLPLRTAEGAELEIISMERVVVEKGRRTLFFARRRARLSLEFRSNSMTRFS